VTKLRDPEPLRGRRRNLVTIAPKKPERFALHFFVPKAVSTKSFGRPRAFRAANSTKRADHKPLRGRSVARACHLIAFGWRMRSLGFQVAHARS
jgi:hypothetical protein